MKVKYKEIADRAVEVLGVLDITRWEEAFNAMKLEGVVALKDSAWYNEILLMSELGTMEADALLTKIESAIPARVAKLIGSEKGMNLVDPQVAGMMNSILGGGAITQVEHDSIMGLASEFKFTWPDLKAGHVQNALEYRAQGKV